MANLHGTLPDTLKETQSICGDLLPPLLLSTTWPTVPGPPGLTLAAFASRGYVRSSGPDLIYVNQPAVTVTVGSAAGLYWLALHRDTHSAVSGWTRRPGSHYLTQQAATQPAHPDGGLVFGYATVAGGVITAVTAPLDGFVTLDQAWRSFIGLGTMAQQNAPNVAITGGTALGLSHVTIGAATHAAAALEAVGLINCSGFRMFTLAGDNYSAYYSNLTAAGGSTRYFLNGAGDAPSILMGNVAILSSNTSSYQLHVNGSAGTPGGAWINSTSFARLKQRIRPLTNALATLLRLRGRQWEWTPDQPDLEAQMPGTQTGLVMEEVAAVRPEWITRDATGTPQGYAERGLSALVVEALRELTARVEALETRLAPPV